MAARKAAGTYRNNRPAVDDQAVDVILRHGRRGVSLRRITQLLDMLGYPPPRGERWARSTVHKVLQRGTSF